MSRILNIAEVDQVLDCEVIAKSPHAFNVGVLVSEVLHRRARDERPEPEAPSYTDDVIAVMRDTITALRGKVAHLEACNDHLRAELRRERDRRVEHRQMNQSLNEQVQRLQARLDGSPLPEGM